MSWHYLTWYIIAPLVIGILANCLTPYAKNFFVRVIDIGLENRIKELEGELNAIKKLSDSYQLREIRRIFAFLFLIFVMLLSISFETQDIHNILKGNQPTQYSEYKGIFLLVMNVGLFYFSFDILILNKKAMNYEGSKKKIEKTIEDLKKLLKPL